MRDVGVNFEVWTLPNSGDFHRIADITRWVVSRDLDLRFSDLSAGSVVVSQLCPYLDDMVVADEDDHTNDVGSTLMLFRDGVWLAAGVFTYRNDKVSDRRPISTFLVQGLEWFMERAILRAFDYPADPMREGDWIYGAPTILPTPGGEVANHVSTFWRSASMSSGTYTITDGVDDTLAINWDEADPTVIQTRIETDLGLVTLVSVAGDGSATYPFIIEVLDPAATSVPLDIGTNSTNGVFTFSTLREGGVPSPRPWHGIVDAVAGVTVGQYEQFDLVAPGGGVPTPPSGAPYVLRINPAAAEGAGDYSGGQVEIPVVPGVRYRTYLDVNSPTSTFRGRLVIRSLDNVTQAQNETQLTAPSGWVRFTAVDVPDGGDYVLFPEGVTTAVYRFGAITEADIDAFYVDIFGALMAPGADVAKYGKIVNDLHAPMITRGVLDWLVATWSDTLDSSGAAWDRDLAWGLRRGQSLLQVKEYAKRWGYEWTLTYNPANPAATPFDWNLYNRNNAGTDTYALGGPTINPRDGMTGEGQEVSRAPKASYAIAEGENGEWGEAEVVALATGWGRLETYYANKQGQDDLVTLATELLTQSADTKPTRIRVRDPINTPLDVIRLGDVVAVIQNTAAGATKTRAMRVVGISIGQRNEPTPYYDYHLDAMVFEDAAAITDAVRSLVRGYAALDLPTSAGVGALDPLYIDQPSGGGPATIAYSWGGPAFVGTGQFQIPLPAGTIGICRLRAKVGPTGADLIGQIKKNGVAVGTVTVAAGANASPAVDVNVASVEGDYLEVGFSQVGATLAGSNMVFTVEHTP